MSQKNKTTAADNAEELALLYSKNATTAAEAINKNRWNAYRYTNKGNLVAVISDGSSIGSEGNAGALASKPVTESTCMLFKIYADIDAFDIEISENNPEKLIKTIQSIAPTFGGIYLQNMEPQKCQQIETRLCNLLDIPIMCNSNSPTRLFPYLFRGALDTLATCINEPMRKSAADRAQELAEQKATEKTRFTEISYSVAQAAMNSGVARRKIADPDEYRATLLSRMEREERFLCDIYRRQKSKLHGKYSMPRHEL